MSASTHAKYEVYSRRSKEIGHVKDADKETDSAKINAHYRFIGQRGSGYKTKDSIHCHRGTFKKENCSGQRGRFDISIRKKLTISS